MTPILSVLIGARGRAATIEECLSSLQSQVDGRVEVILADCSDDGTADLVQTRFPWVRVLRCAPMNAAELRGLAFAASRGSLIALAEPHITFAPTWVAAALAAGRHGAAAVGGTVAPGRRVHGVGPWAAFLCEYADFLPPLREGPTRLTTGNNVVYPRSILESVDVRDGLAKAWINDSLARGGAMFWTDPALVVSHERPYAFRTLLNKRFHYGRCYGATRARGWSRWQRVVRSASTLLLPVLFAWRIVRAVLPKRRYLVPLIMSQPLLFLFHAWWAFGEACGYLAGPSDSCERVY